MRSCVVEIVRYPQPRPERRWKLATEQRYEDGLAGARQNKPRNIGGRWLVYQLSIVDSRCCFLSFPMSCILY